MDIPVYDDPIQSLHLLFSLYLEFKSNPIFQQQLDMDRGYMSGPMEEGGLGSTMPGGSDSFMTFG